MAVLAVAFVALALLKPWAIGTPAESTGANVSGPSEATPSASPVPGPSVAPVHDPNAMACLGPIGVELLTLVRWPGHEIRTWQPTAGAIGDDPLDPSLVPVSVLSSHVLGLGLCEEKSGAAGPSTTAASLLEVVSLTGSGASPKALGSPIRITLPQASPDFAVLYGPPTGAGRLEPSGQPDAGANPSLTGTPAGEAGSAAMWAVGTYGLSFQFEEESPSRVHWLVFQVTAIASELK